MSANNLWPASPGRRGFLQLSAGSLAVAAIGLALDAPAEASGLIKVAMKIITGKMIGRPGWPQFEPGDLTLPPNRLVEVTLRCFDDGDAQIPGGYNRVTGTVGDVMRLIKGTPSTIAPGAGKVVAEIPVKQVAHTFTVNGKGFFMNVPAHVSSTMIYRFKTPGPGKYPWQCMAACGTGAGGWAGPMMTEAWMQGMLTIT